jgi:hypothetical protein
LGRNLASGAGADGKPELHYPYGKSGEVYLEALNSALQEGGTVGEYAQYLLDVISKQKKQSYQPKRSRRDDDGLRWRTDGYLVPLR